ncbi:unnamed protein product, partial [Urochloa humidicola]
AGTPQGALARVGGGTRREKEGDASGARHEEQEKQQPAPHFGLHHAPRHYAVALFCLATGPALACPTSSLDRRSAY